MVAALHLDQLDLGGRERPAYTPAVRAAMYRRGPRGSQAARCRRAVSPRCTASAELLNPIQENGWVTRWREQGRQRSRLFALKRDAEAFDREVKRRGQLGLLAVQQLTARGGPTLGQWSAGSLSMP